jgi:hypothetical protein
LCSSEVPSSVASFSFLLLFLLRSFFSPFLGAVEEVEEKKEEEEEEE